MDGLTGFLISLVSLIAIITWACVVHRKWVCFKNDDKENFTHEMNIMTNDGDLSPWFIRKMANLLLFWRWVKKGSIEKD
jgi:hypothetical protein